MKGFLYSFVFLPTPQLLFYFSCPLNSLLQRNCHPDVSKNFSLTHSKLFLFSPHKTRAPMRTHMHIKKEKKSSLIRAGCENKHAIVLPPPFYCATLPKTLHNSPFLLHEQITLLASPNPTFSFLNSTMMRLFRTFIIHLYEICFQPFLLLLNKLQTPVNFWRHN